jgi:transposase
MRESVFSSWHLEEACRDHILRIFVIGLLQRFLEVRRPAQRFSISESTAIRWAQRLSAEGHAKARAMGGDRRSRLTEHRVTVLTLVAHKPDLTLAEIRDELNERHGVTVGLGTVWRFLAGHDITLKKKSARRRAAAS